MNLTRTSHVGNDACWSWKNGFEKMMKIDYKIVYCIFCDVTLSNTEIHSYQGYPKLLVFVQKTTRYELF